MAAGVEVLRETSYADLTVRAVAARAKVAPATAYTYFSSKNHLIAEVYLDLVRQVPYFTDVNEPMPTRVDKALRHLALVVADEPEVAAACTTALLGGGGDPAVRSVRDRIGAEIHRRITSAIGPDAEPRIVSVLEMTFFGALVNAASGAYTYHQIADHLAYAVGLICQNGRLMTTSDRQATPLLDPYDYDFHEDPYPYYQAAARRGPAVPQRGARLLGVVPTRTTCTRAFATAPRCPTSTASRWTRRRADRTPPRPCRFWPWTIPRTCGCGPWCQKASRPGGFASSSHASPRSRSSTSTPCWRRPSDGAVDYVDEFAGKLPMDVISELMGVPEPDRVQVRAWADGVMHRDDGVTDVPPEAIEASLNLIVYYQEMVAERRKKLTDDLTSALLEAEIDGDRLTDDEVLGFMFLMVIAGNETTTKLLANAAFWGHRNPDQLTPVYDDLSRVPLWVEETLRYDTSSQILARSVSGELTLYDTTIPDGDVLLLLPGSGHRDERAFENPDDFVIGRDIGSKLLEFRQRRPLLPGRAPGADGSPGRAHRVVQANPRISRSTRPTPSASTPAMSADSLTYR